MVKFLKGKPKIYSEIQCKCNQCGKIWHYTNKDIAEQKRKGFSNFSKDFYQACGCCVLGAMMPRDQIRDLTRCPRCESKDVTKKEIQHEYKE